VLCVGHGVLLSLLLLLQLGDLELLVPPPPSSAAVVAFVLKFLAGYGNTLQSNSSTAAAAAGGTGAAVSGVGRDVSVPLASFGADPQRDKGLGMHRLVRGGGRCSEGGSGEGHLWWEEGRRCEGS